MIKRKKEWLSEKGYLKERGKNLINEKKTWSLNYSNLNLDEIIDKNLEKHKQVFI